MLSRLADSLYWIGRYVERAEDTARLTDVAFHYTLGMGSTADAASRRARHWEGIVSIAGDPTAFWERNDEATEDTVVPYLTFDTKNLNSIVSCVTHAREQARILRHQIASEMWEALNRFYLEMQRQLVWTSGTIGAEFAHSFYRDVKEFSHLFQGVTDSTMPREEGWYFLQTGKFVERATKTARALDVKYHLLLPDGSVTDEVPGELHQWQALLRSLSGYEAFHKLYRSAVRPSSVVDLILFSAIFPRSVRFAVEQVEEALRRIAVARVFDVEQGGVEFIMPSSTLPDGQDEAARMVGRLRSRLAYGSIDEVFSMGIHEYLVDVQRRCAQIGEAIQTQYFAPRIMRPEEVVA